ncbi:MAG: murein biosynthesis integral membrane protein MurJ [Lentisphaeria bacterium]|nr:murein biosynthesis integral membrane protein MurJ [Lentisphaeria bacterium]
MKGSGDTQHKKVAGKMVQMSLAILFSRVTGFFRDVVFAVLWGTSGVMASFVIAFKIPNLFRSLFGEGALTAAFVPLFVKVSHDDGETSALKFTGNFLAVISIFLTVLVTALILITFLLRTFFQSPFAQLTLKLSAWFLPFLVFVCISAILSGLINIYGNFLLPAMLSSMTNVIFMLTAWFICPLFGDQADVQLFGMVIAVLSSGILQVLILTVWLRKHKVSVPLSTKADPNTFKLFKLATPALVGAGLSQINSFVDSMLAIFLGSIAVSSLYFSQRLVFLPVGIFAVALGTVCLPTMSKSASAGRLSEVGSAVNFSLRLVLFLTIPAALYFLAFRNGLVELVFGYGNFNDESATQTAWALMFYLPGLPFFSAAKVVLPAYHSRLNFKTPIKIAGGCLVINLVLNLILMNILQQGGLALATSISSACNILLLLYFLKADLGNLGLKAVLRRALEIIALTVLSLWPGLYLYHNFTQWGIRSTTLLSFFVSALAFVLLALLFKAPELEVLTRRLKRRSH